MTLYGAEIWTLRATDQKRLESFEMCWRRMEKICNPNVLYIRIPETAFNKKKNLFTSKLDLNLKKKLVKCYVWSMALYGAETWTP